MFLLLSFRGVNSCDHTHGPMLTVTCLLASKLHCPDGVPASGVPLDSRVLPSTASLVWHSFSSTQCQPHDLPSFVYEQNATIECSSSASLTSLNSCRNINLFERICPSAMDTFHWLPTHVPITIELPVDTYSAEAETAQASPACAAKQHKDVFVSFTPFSSPAVSIVHGSKSV